MPQRRPPGAQRKRGPNSQQETRLLVLRCRKKG
jgi:hypothetical protein